jgi:hypothetical protein
MERWRVKREGCDKADYYYHVVWCLDYCTKMNPVARHWPTAEIPNTQPKLNRLTHEILISYHHPNKPSLLIRPAFADLAYSSPAEL